MGVSLDHGVRVHGTQRSAQAGHQPAEEEVDRPRLEGARRGVIAPTMTVPGDRLPALAGLADALSRVNLDWYLYGCGKGTSPSSCFGASRMPTPAPGSTSTLPAAGPGRRSAAKCGLMWLNTYLHAESCLPNAIIGEPGRHLAR
jgi:hypothetical protein